MARSGEDKKHGGKDFVIIVNGEQKPVDKKELIFDQVAELAFPGMPISPNIHLTITYRFHRGKDAQPEEVMIRGEKVEVQKGMIFNVTRTDKS